MFGAQRWTRKYNERVIREMGASFAATLRASQGPTALYDGYRNRWIATGDLYQLEQMLKYVRLTDEVPR